MNYTLNKKRIMKIFIIFLTFGMLSCTSNSEIKKDEKTGNFSGIFKHGNFSDKIVFEIERDSVGFKVFLQA